MFDISKIYTLICQLKTIGNYAYDIHYSANGKEFYSEHKRQNVKGNYNI